MRKNDLKINITDYINDLKTKSWRSDFFMETESNFRKTYSHFSILKKAQKTTFPGRIGLYAAISIMLQFQIADAQRVNVFEQPVEKPEKISALITKAARKYKLDRRLLSCLYKIESNYTLEAESTTNDHGIGQINGKTARSLKIDIKKLKTDLKYSVYQSAGILAYYKWLKATDEPTTWVCRYNVGPGRKLEGNVYLLCMSYLAKINWCRNGSFAVL